MRRITSRRASTQHFARRVRTVVALLRETVDCANDRPRGYICLSIAASENMTSNAPPAHGSLAHDVCQRLLTQPTPTPCCLARSGHRQHRLQANSTDALVQIISDGMDHRGGGVALKMTEAEGDEARQADKLP